MTNCRAHMFHNFWIITLCVKTLNSYYKYSSASILMILGTWKHENVCGIFPLHKVAILTPTCMYNKSLTSSEKLLFVNIVTQLHPTRFEWNNIQKIFHNSANATFLGIGWVKYSTNSRTNQSMFSLWAIVCQYSSSWHSTMFSGLDYSCWLQLTFCLHQYYISLSHHPSPSPTFHLRSLWSK